MSHNAEKDAPCNCAHYGHARLCPHHTQEDFDVADRAIGRVIPPGKGDSDA